MEWPLSWKSRLLVVGLQMRMVLSQEPDAYRDIPELRDAPTMAGTLHALRVISLTYQEARC